MVKEQTDPEEFRERIQVEQGVCIIIITSNVSNVFSTVVLNINY